MDKIIANKNEAFTWASSQGLIAKFDNIKVDEFGNCFINATEEYISDNAQGAIYDVKVGGKLSIHCEEEVKETKFKKNKSE